MDSRLRPSLRETRRKRLQPRQDKFTEITDGDLPWEDVRKALDEVNFTGWATAEVKGGGLERLVEVREQMQKAFGL